MIKTKVLEKTTIKLPSSSLLKWFKIAPSQPCPYPTTQTQNLIGSELTPKNSVNSKAWVTEALLNPLSWKSVPQKTAQLQKTEVKRTKRQIKLFHR